MSIATGVQKIVDDFIKAHPELKKKVYLTSGDRTWEEQLDIILDPKRRLNYLNIKAAYRRKFKTLQTPKSRAALSAAELKWWEKEIMKQAGRSPGFPHVGGKAQDVSVKLLSKELKKELKAKFQKKYGVLMERVTATKSFYGVSLKAANVFHVYE